MNKVFILEDDSNRIWWFKENFKHCDITFAIDIDTAMQTFKPPYDCIFLDHDLGGLQMVDSLQRNTGYQFVKYMCESFKKDIIDTDIVVHSLNPNGTKNMLMHLNSILKPNHIFRIPMGDIMTLWENNQIAVCSKYKKDIDNQIEEI